MEYIRSLLVYVMVQGKDGAWFSVDEIRVSLVALLSRNVPSISRARQKEREIRHQSYLVEKRTDALEVPVNEGLAANT